MLRYPNKIFWILPFLCFSLFYRWGQQSTITIDPVHEIYELGLGTHNKSIEIDQQGYLWVGGDNGLFRFDGKRVESIGLPFVKTVKRSSDGKLLVLSDDGLFSINPGAFGWFMDTLLTVEQSLSDTTLYYPKSLYEDVNGVLSLLPGSRKNLFFICRNTI